MRIRELCWSVSEGEMLAAERRLTRAIDLRLVILAVEEGVKVEEGEWA